MALGNQTEVTVFILQSFTEDPGLQATLFCFFFTLFVVALVGNGLIVMAIHFSPNLHTPMYFFLVNLAMLDMICTSTILPKALQSLVADNTISFSGCLSQMFFFTWSLSSELLLFTAMAYDRYLAICRPLHYGTLMSGRVCLVLAAFVWTSGLFNAFLLTGLVVRLSFCGPNIIAHFFCEIPPVLLLSCSPTFLVDVIVITADMFLSGMNFLLTMASYGCIISNILRIRSAEGKRRAFSTCSSHLIVVTMYYSTVLYAYIRPVLGSAGLLDKAITILYTVMTPALNPLIYTLRNKEFKASFKKLLLLFSK
ncbi:olfactory receptor 13A1-like [Dasypus novemcinctus]|uniref:olfactory receptor 13A1-like n=1 Tax=Dasypus novemcinctus TaxID=9361 RepID=UPI0003292CDC|nr:olfactory receptor 13A1-like [Dasypus novemcinctus]